MSMGNYLGCSGADQQNNGIEGKIINRDEIYLKNNESNPSLICGTLKYFSQNTNSQFIQYYSNNLKLAVGDIVTFNLSNNPINIGNGNPTIYANNIRKTKSGNIKSSKSPVRLICISDTHNNHEELTKELISIYESESDILIHCGDMTDSGSERELKNINQWFGKLPFKKEHIIITAGNMDGIGLDKNKRYNNYNYNGYDHDSDNDIEIQNNYTSNLGKKIFTNAIYLEHESYYLKEFNLRFFASPYSMKFVGGFQINNDKDAQLKWKQVPNNTDILICHGPPKGILDETSGGKHTGDAILLKHVLNRIKPKVMLFGHMHSSFGSKIYKNINFYNCAQNNSLGRNHYGNSGNGYSYHYSNTKKNNMDKNEKPHIIDFGLL